MEKNKEQNLEIQVSNLNLLARSDELLREAQILREIPYQSLINQEANAQLDVDMAVPLGILRKFF